MAEELAYRTINSSSEIEYNSSDNIYSDSLGCFPWEPHSLDTLTIVYFAFLGVVFFFGIIGNGSLIALFLGVKVLRDINNAFIINLAIADTLYTTVFIPIEIYKELYTLRPFGWFMCHFSISLNYTSQAVSIFSLTTLSILRFRAVVFPLQPPLRRRRCMTMMGCLAIWVVSLCLAFPLTVQCFVDEYDDCLSGRRIREHRLVMTSDFFLYYIPIQFAILYLLPLIAISTMYGKMARTLVGVKLPTGRSSDSGAVGTSRRRLAMIVLLLVLVFAVCWFPYHIRLLVVSFQSKKNPVISDETNTVIANVQFSLTLLSSVLNPLVLYLTSSTFREYLVDTFCLLRRRNGRRRIETERNVATQWNVGRTTSSSQQSRVRLNVRQTVTAV